MTTFSKWFAGISGNWNNPGFWTGGAPNSNTDTDIDASGTFTVHLTSTAASNSLLMDAAGGTLLQSAASSLNVTNGATFDAGIAILNGTNSFGGTIIDGGTVELGSSGALGANGLLLDSGELLSLANVTLTNAISLDGPFRFRRREPHSADAFGRECRVRPRHDRHLHRCSRRCRHRGLEHVRRGQQQCGLRH